MITVKESKVYLADFDLSDKQVEQFRDSAYSIVNEILDELYETKNHN